MARCSLRRRWKDANIRGYMVSTVHDSIVLDVHPESVDKACDLLYNVFVDLPGNVSRIFGVEFTLETRVEISVGDNMYNLKECK